MSSKELIAEKSLAKLMQYLKNEETSLQEKIPLIQARLNYNRIIQTILLKIVSKEEKEQKDLQEKISTKCLFKERGSSKFCGRKTVKGSNYCVKHKKELSGSRNN